MDKKEKIIAFGEVMLRLTPPDYTTISQANNFIANYGGCEANVLVSLAHFKHHTYFISRIPDNQLGDSVLEHLRGHGVNMDYVVRGSSNLGMYFVETGFGGRPSRVIYNRKHSAITRINSKEINYDDIFKDATWFHLSGISLALGAKVREVIFLCLEACKKYGVRVSFDFNYRSKLWSKEEAAPYFKKVIPYVDVLFGNDFDLHDILGLKGKSNNNENSSIALAKELFKISKVNYVIGTRRVTYTSNDNSLSSYCISRDGKLIEEKPIRFNIYERIGGGDALASGVIHGLLKNYNDPDYAIKFGLATSVLKHTLYGDVCTLSIKEVEDFMNNKEAKVDR